MAEKIQQTLSDLWQQWDDDQIGILTDSTRKRYRSVGNRFVDWFEQDSTQPPTLDDWHNITLVGYYEQLKMRVKAQTLNTHLSALRQFGEWLIDQQYADRNPARRLKMIQIQPSTAPVSLSAKQVNALLRSVALTRNAARNLAVLQMMLQAGLRVSECAQLKVGDLVIGERAGLMTVQYAKAHKTRQVPLNKSARQAIADYLAPTLDFEPTLKALADVWPTIPSGNPLWLSERKLPLSIRAIERMFQQEVQNCAGRRLIPDKTTLHSLRHSFAKHYLKQHPGDLVGLALLLGHSSIRATAVYVRPSAQEMAKRVDELPLNVYAS